MITKLMDGLPNQSMAQGPFDEAVAKYMTELPLRGAEENALLADVKSKQVLVNESAASAAASVNAATAQAAAAQAARDAAVVARIAAQAAATDAHEAATGTVLTGTSTTPLVIGTGNKTLATQAGKQYAANIFITAVSASDPTRFMSGTVASYAGTALTIAVTAVGGNGDTKSDWNISVTGAPGVAASAALKGNAMGAIELLKGTAPAASATPDIWAAGGNRVPISSGTTITGFPAAPQVGAQRTLVATVAFPITSGPNLIIAGGSTTMAVGDELDVTAETPTLFKAWVRRASGASGVLTGDTLTTVRSLPAPDWLLCDGSAYLKTSYPALYAVIGNLLALQDAPSITGPSVPPSGIAVSGDGNWAVIGRTGQEPYLLQRTGNTWTNSTLPNTITIDGGAAINPDGTLICVASANNSEVSFFSRSGSTVTKINPSGYTFVSGDYSPKFSPDGTKFFLRKAATPYFNVYSVSGTVLTKLPNPAVAAGTGLVVDGSFSTDNKYLAIATTNAPYVEVYKIEGTTLTKLAPLDVSGFTASSRCVSVNLDATGSTLVALINYYPFVLIYSRVGDVFSRMPELTPSLVGLVWEPSSCSITQDGNHIITTSPVPTPGYNIALVNIYKKVAGVFTKTTTNITMPSGGGAYKHSLSTNGKLLLISGSFTGFAKAFEQSYDPVTQFGVPGIFVGAPTFIKT